MTSIPHLSPQGSGTITEEGGRQTVRGRGLACETVSSGHHRAIAPMNPQKIWLPVPDLAINTQSWAGKGLSQEPLLNTQWVIAPPERCSHRQTQHLSTGISISCFLSRRGFLRQRQWECWLIEEDHLFEASGRSLCSAMLHHALPCWRTEGPTGCVHRLPSLGPCLCSVN